MKKNKIETLTCKYINRSNITTYVTTSSFSFKHFILFVCVGVYVYSLII